ncbi:Inorganic phosphate transporter pho84 [Tulasnella sp. 331]|nr:Inorganic phosphate transporter pho84 [Tulasnella sp. 331]
MQNEAPVGNNAQRRRNALAGLNNAAFGWNHVKICLIAGVGFFTDSYDLFAISICAQMIEIIYSQSGVADLANPGLANHQDFGLKVASPIGTLVGQLIFGWAADIVGRKKMYGFELMLILITTFGQVLAGNAYGANIYGVLITYRFLMGIGIGGDYPLSAIIVSEFAPTNTRGRMMNAVFAMQAVGQLFAALVSLAVISAFRSHIIANQNSIDQVWRVIIGLGMIPAALATYARLTIPEPPRFTMDVERNLEQAEQDADFVESGKFERIDDRPVQPVKMPKASKRDFKKYYSQWKNSKILVGTSWSWLAQDIAFYGLALNSSTILSEIGFGSPKIPGAPDYIYITLRNSAVGNIILALAGLIPGYVISFALIDVWGRKPIQFTGFAMLTVIFLCMGLGYDVMVEQNRSVAAFVFLYCLSNFFQNFGPNSTTFIVPGEVFPTRYRSTSHGISAASGKLGAIIAQIVFSRLSKNGLKVILLVFAGFMFTGIFSTMLLPETMGISLERLSGEEDREDESMAHEMN